MLRRERDKPKTGDYTICYGDIMNHSTIEEYDRKKFSRYLIHMVDSLLRWSVDWFSVKTKFH